MLDHLRDSAGAKSDFGVYNALAVMAYLVKVIDPACNWPEIAANHLAAFPVGALSAQDMGAPEGWEKHSLWQKR